MKIQYSLLSLICLIYPAVSVVNTGTIYSNDMHDDYYHTFLSNQIAHNKELIDVIVHENVTSPIEKESNEMMVDVLLEENENNKHILSELGYDYIYTEKKISKERRNIFDNATTKISSSVKYILSKLVNAFEDLIFMKNKDLDDYNGQFNLCKMEHDIEKCSLSSLRRKAKEWGKEDKGWIVVPENGRCLDGTPFAFQVFPGETDETVYHFQQGGACWNYMTCIDFPVALTKFYPEMWGAFNFDNSRNPISTNKMTAVVNNYCTADAHIGNGAKTLINTEDPSKNRVVYQQGWANTHLVLDWIKLNSKKHNPSSESDIVIDTISGSSAGAIGVQVYLDYFAKNFNIKRAMVDSYIGIFPNTAGRIMTHFGVCDYIEELGMGQYKTQCDQGELYDLPNLFKELIEKNSNIYIEYVGTSQDIVQKLFYALMVSDNYNSIIPFAKAMSDIFLSFSSQLDNILKNNESRFNNFGFYLKSLSQQHVFLSLPTLYIEGAITKPMSLIKYTNNFLQKP